MSPRQQLCYALGELAYAVAKIDGEVVKAERQKLHDIISKELSPVDFNFEISKIIFEMVDKQNKDAETVYKDAVETIICFSDSFDHELRLVFLRALEKMERAEPPIANAQKELLQRFRNEIRQLSN
jgi:uncharacterized tellurite resistance protein B-like protein